MILSSFKKNLLVCSLIAVAVPYINSTPAFNKPKLENWLITVRYALEGLPKHEVDTIERLVQQKIQRVNLDDKNLVTQLIHGTLVEYIKQQTWNDIEKLAQKIYLTQQEQDDIINEYTKNFAHQINHMHTIEGKNIQQFFGDHRASTIAARVNYTVQQKPHTSYPAAPPCYYPITPGLQMPPVIPDTHYADNREYCAQQHAQAIAYELKGIISDAHIQRLQVLVADSTRYLRHIPADDRKSLVKTGFAQLLDEQLDAYQKKLSPWIVNQQKLTDGVITTRQKGIATIDSLYRENFLGLMDMQKIKSLFGDCGDRNCIEEEIITNMDIQCPICREEFMQEHRNGKADRVILKSTNYRRSCGHAVCKDCIKNYDHTLCPQCRVKIDKKDLDAKLKK